jgi:hypothetical protein
MKRTPVSREISGEDHPCKAKDVPWSEPPAGQSSPAFLKAHALSVTRAEWHWISAPKFHFSIFRKSKRQAKPYQLRQKQETLETHNLSLIMRSPHYPIQLHWSEDDGKWVATSPANAELGRTVPESLTVADLKLAGSLLKISALATRAGLSTARSGEAAG